MFSSFRWRLTASYLLLISLVLLVVGIFVSLSFKQYYYRDLESNLIYEARLLAETTSNYEFKHDTENIYQHIAHKAGRDTDKRITIVDYKGKVLGDSVYDPSQMEPHNDRPEIYAALHGRVGINSRLSSTAHEKMLYVAVPFSNNDTRGAVRLAVSLAAIEDFYNHIILMMVLAILISGFITGIISFLIAKRVSEPVGVITQAVKDMAQGDLKRRISWHADDELGVLARAINNMADRIDHNIHEISAVKNHLELLLNNTVNGILMVAADGRINYANPVALQLIGRNDNMVGKKPFEVISNFELLDMIDEVRCKNNNVRKEVKLYNQGEKILVAHAVPIAENEGFLPTGVLLVLNDISELKKLETVRRDFVANVSHELKTPVASISGFAETLLAEDSDNPRVHEFSRIIFEEAQRLKRIIEGLLELSRLESGKLQINYRETDLQEIIADSINTIRRRSGRIIEFTPSVEPVTIKADPDLISQVLINYLDNAVIYSDENTPINVALETNTRLVKVIISDQGEGIPENELDRVFERFYRVDKTRSRKTGGTGLGLSIVKHLVENHGGEVGAESRLGKGSIFWFTLPRNL
ncbi:ATP-binding protein [Syntrophomonas palmitatica]|uniref:ATP-binding protein n=1 Tax=Syntrophomonas palmitatica TaxID=402877 RepID=UPI0006CFFA54|nr:ATP-binding protein [Syntrophomonas palmitatica]